MRRTSSGVLAEQLADLVADALGLGAGEVDLVHHGDQLEPGVDRQVGVGERLRLDALRRVDDQQRALACGERPRYLVAEVDVARRVDQVELVGLPVARRVRTRTAWALIVIPRSRSRSIVSSTWSRIFIGSTERVSSRMRSASVDFP